MMSSYHHAFALCFCCFFKHFACFQKQPFDNLKSLLDLLHFLFYLPLILRKTHIPSGGSSNEKTQSLLYIWMRMTNYCKSCPMSIFHNSFFGQNFFIYENSFNKIIKKIIKKKRKKEILKERKTCKFKSTTSI